MGSRKNKKYRRQAERNVVGMDGSSQNRSPCIGTPPGLEQHFGTDGLEAAAVFLRTQMRHGMMMLLNVAGDIHHCLSRQWCDGVAN